MAAPSANRSGHVSPTTAAHVLADLRGRIELIVDGGPAPLGLESTITACVGEPTLLPPGALPRAAIEQLLARGGHGSGSASRLAWRQKMPPQLRPVGSPRTTPPA